MKLLLHLESNFQKHLFPLSNVIFTDTISSRIKRSPYLYPYRQDYHQYFVDESKRDVNGKYFKNSMIKSKIYVR